MRDDLPDDALLAQLLELAETQQWAHDVVDMDTGVVQTTLLDRPVTTLSRIGRLSALGHRWDTSIFGGPSYRLTARAPFRESPQAFLSAANPNFYVARDDEIVWQPPRELGTNFVPRRLRFFFEISPDRRSVMTFSLKAKSWPGLNGNLRVTIGSSAINAVIPLTETFTERTIDVTFVPLGGRATEALLHIEAGVELLTFRSVVFQAEQPGLDPG